MDISRCGQCNDVFSNRKELNMHRLTAHIANLVKIPCPHCNIFYQDLQQHMHGVHGVQGPVCPYCAFLGKRNWALKLHIEQVHLNIQIHKPAPCPICKKIFVKKGHMERHIKMVHEGIREGSRPCKYCSKEMCNPAALEKHEAMVHEGVREECPICFKVLCDLYKHMRIVHGRYQRKAKLPKECLDRLDDPTFTIVPKIYGAAPSRRHLDSMQPVTGLTDFKAIEQTVNVVGSLGKRTFDNQPKRTRFASSMPPSDYANNPASGSVSTNQNMRNFPPSTNPNFNISPLVNPNLDHSAMSANQRLSGSNTSFQDILTGKINEHQVGDANKMAEQQIAAPDIKIKDEPMDPENDEFLSVIASIFNTPPLIKLEPDDESYPSF